MKKTYTACFLLVLGSLFYYSNLKGGATPRCPRDERFAGMVYSPSCNTGCHGGGGAVVVDTTGISQSTDTTSSTTAGIADVIFRQGLAAYPTVTSDMIKIATTHTSKGMSYTVYNLEGRQMMSDVLPAFPSLTFVDVRALAPAQYVIRVVDGERSATFRMVKM